MPELFGGWVVDPDAAVVGRDRLGPGRGVGAQVGRVDRRAGRGQAGAWRSADLALVEVVEAGVGEALERRRQRRQPDELARAPRPAVRPVDRSNPAASGPSAAANARRVRSTAR